MMMRSALTLSTALVLALGAGGALAQDVEPYTHMSTPQEQAQTNQLNQAQLSGTQVAQNDDQYDAQQQSYSDAQDRYQDQQSQYEDRQAQYQADQDNYRDRQDAYNDANGDDAENDIDDVSVPTALDELSGTPRDRLIGMDVERDNGHILGRIQNIDVRDDGRISSAQIVLRNGDVAWVRAGALSYDPNEDAVFTDLTMAELDSMAASG